MLEPFTCMHQNIEYTLGWITRGLYLIYLNFPDSCVKIQALIAFNCSDLSSSNAKHFSPNNRR